MFDGIVDLRPEISIEKFKPKRFQLAPPLSSGARQQYRMCFTLPVEACTDTKIRITMVQEQVCWFDKAFGKYIDLPMPSAN